MGDSLKCINEDELNTGDILLFRGDSNDSLVDKLIEDVTDSVYEHAAIIVRDPWWIGLTGLFALESSSGALSIQNEDTQERQKGVQLQPFTYFKNTRKWVDARKLSGVDIKSESFKKRFGLIHLRVHNKPYNSDICDWIKTGMRILCGKRCCPPPKKTDKKFWCSALVAYIYVEMGWMEDIDWSDITPADLSKMNAKSPAKLGEIVRVI